MTTQAVVPIGRQAQRSTVVRIDAVSQPAYREPVPPVRTRIAPDRRPGTGQRPPGLASESEVGDVGDGLTQWALSVMSGVAALVPCACIVGGPWM